MASKLSVFLGELKQRKVYRVAAVYVAVGVAISLGVPDLFSAFDLSSSAARLVIILIVIGFPIALVLAWADELDPAFYWLERAIDWGISNASYLGLHDPFLADLRSEPRFEQLLAKTARVSERRKAVALAY